MIRITSGYLKGRQIKAMPGLNTRPTLSRLRQAWMNAWQFALPDAEVLDVFAGTGALGFEAISRGAARVVFIEMDRKTCDLIRENAESLKVTAQVEILCMDAEKAAANLTAEFDLVFMDPPYRKGWEEKILTTYPWEKILKPDGKIGVESCYDKVMEPFCPMPLQVVRDQRYGETRLTMYSLKTGASAE